MISLSIERADTNSRITREYGDTMRIAERKAVATSKCLIKSNIGCDINVRDALGGLRYRVTQSGKIQKTP